ncbi:hypothetical protein Y032_0038g3652 [Ancylostoma ceylanicum]|uniref:Uncharacterized protein n=1 Tax=Ancylostoma ceylanicum TaxID=53326 RepID=A0A016UIF6_9BILA|nr:hypothetical protein Y032_0038g3652 [Ancylostoma ceylanicum]
MLYPYQGFSLRCRDSPSRPSVPWTPSHNSIVLWIRSRGILYFPTCRMPCGTALMPRERRPQTRQYKSRPLILISFIRLAPPYRPLCSARGPWFDDAAVPDYVASPLKPSSRRQPLHLAAACPIHCR